MPYSRHLLSLPGETDSQTSGSLHLFLYDSFQPWLRESRPTARYDPEVNAAGRNLSVCDKRESELRYEILRGGGRRAGTFSPWTSKLFKFKVEISHEINLSLGIVNKSNFCACQAACLLHV